MLAQAFEQLPVGLGGVTVDRERLRDPDDLAGVGIDTGVRR
jgi:hypothetical protein